MVFEAPSIASVTDLMPSSGWIDARVIFEVFSAPPGNPVVATDGELDALSDGMVGLDGAAGGLEAEHAAKNALETRIASVLVARRTARHLCFGGGIPVGLEERLHFLDRCWTFDQDPEFEN